MKPSAEAVDLDLQENKLSKSKELPRRCGAALNLY